MLLNNLHDMFSPLLSFSFLTMRDARQKNFFVVESTDWGGECTYVCVDVKDKKC